MWERGCNLVACFEVCAEPTSAPAAPIWGSQRAIGSHVLDHVYGIQWDFSSLFCLLCGGFCPICYVVALLIFCFCSQSYDAHEWIRISCISNKAACVPQISRIDLRPCPATEALDVESGLLCKHHYTLVPVKSCYFPVIMELFTYRKHQSVRSSGKFK